MGRRSEEFAAKDHVEVEWQLEATDLDLAESWLKKPSPTSDLAAIPDLTKDLLDAYYDTEDWRSCRAGYSLRVRRDGESAEATMKVLTPAEGPLRQRREISEPPKDNAKTPKVTRGPAGERMRRLDSAGPNPSRASNLDLKQRTERSNKRAGAVVAMGGYNTTTELLAARKPALIVPRVEPRTEQLIRTRRLASLGLVEMIHPRDLTPPLMRSRVEDLLRREPSTAPNVEVDLSGAARAVKLICASVAEKRVLAVGV